MTNDYNSSRVVYTHTTLLLSPNAHKYQSRSIYTDLCGWSLSAWLWTTSYRRIPRLPALLLILPQGSILCCVFSRCGKTAFSPPQSMHFFFFWCKPWCQRNFEFIIHGVIKYKNTCCWRRYGSLGEVCFSAPRGWMFVGAVSPSLNKQNNKPLKITAVRCSLWQPSQK